MDVRMPNCDGLAATRLIKAEQPGVKVVMLTSSADDADLFEAIKSGASGYLLKSLSGDEFFDYLSGLKRGEAPISRECAARLLKEFARQADREDETLAKESDALTPRQAQILTLVAQGFTYKEVGARLGLSEHTVKYHMGDILRRLHLRNRSEVVAYAVRSGLVKGTPRV
jgi:DNA-binding NarL/FixJ family response regulator